MKRFLRYSVNFIPPAFRPYVRYIPILATIQRKLVSEVLSKESFIHKVNHGPSAGVCFEIQLPEDKAIWAGTYETPFATAIASRVRKGGTSYDIGGFRGYMSASMAAAGSRVFVFEPLPANQRNLQRLCELNPQLPVEMIPVAVGVSDGVTRSKSCPMQAWESLAPVNFKPGGRLLNQSMFRFAHWIR